MVKTITQKILFKNASPEQLYDLYMDSKKHSQSTGEAAKILNKEGAAFTAYSGYITGKNLQLVPGKSIVQAWRSKDFTKSDVDSTFTLLFEKKGNDTTVHMVHANIPNAEAAGIKKGWNDFYWKPWKNFLSGNAVKKTGM